MTDSLRTRVAEELRARAADAPHPSDLASRAMGHGRRIRARRRGLVAATGAAAVVLALLLALPGDRPRRAAPPADPSPSTSVTSEPSGEPHWPVPARSGEIRKWLSGLPRGDRPAVPYQLDGRLVDGDLVIEGVGHRTWPVARTAAGLLVLRHTAGFTGAEDFGASYGLVDDGGRFTELASGEPVGAGVSADGRRVALGVQSLPRGGEPLARILAYDVVARRVLDEIRVTPDYASVKGWAGDGVVLVTGPEGLPTTGLWRPAGPITPLGARLPVLATASDLGRLVVEADGGTCTWLVTVQAPFRPLAKGCGVHRWTSVSPQTTRALTEQQTVVGLSGDGPAALKAPQLSARSVWEDDAHVLLVIDDPGEGNDRFPQTVVRCAAPRWTCEVALTAPATSGLGPGILLAGR